MEPDAGRMDPARPGVRVDSLHKQGTYYYLCDLPKYATHIYYYNSAYFHRRDS